MTMTTTARRVGGGGGGVLFFFLLFYSSIQWVFFFSFSFFFRLKLFGRFIITGQRDFAAGAIPSHTVIQKKSTDGPILAFSFRLLTSGVEMMKLATSTLKTLKAHRWFFLIIIVIHYDG